MNRIDFGELNAFAAVAEHRSFTRAAAQLGVALPTVSQTIRGLEERLGVRLFNRTTRSVALTEAGARLLDDVQPILGQLAEALERVNSFREKPMGSIRLAVSRPFATRVVAPLLKPFLSEYPEIRVEMVVEDARTDIVKSGFDAGIRVGYQVERDMTTLRITEPYRMLAVAAPAYLDGRPRPETPRDLHAHNCIQARAPWDGAILPWLFVNGDQRAEVAVAGSLTVNDADVWLRCVLDGVGVGFLPEPMVAPYIARGALVSLFADWSGERSGVFLYHPSRRQPPAPLQALISFIEDRRGGSEVWPSAV
ncbi:LysR family transcriptional regulator [Phenylobacterium sp. LjRoot219]|uniref:LysR family transcriptional regulator n=1 Tax=Phenylobacterium sp. LjRoot219 TaxID=3342283 RepID=UPI003ECFD2E5